MLDRAVVVERRIGPALAVGFAGGFLGGLFGIGGVVLVVLIVSVLGLRQHLAQGTTLAVITLTALVSGIRYAQHGFLPPDVWLLALELATGAVVGVNIGARVMNRLPARRLRRIFGVLTVLVGLRMLLVANAGGPAPFSLQSGDVLIELGLLLLLGIATGVLSGLLGIGGGVFLIPLLVLLFGLPQQIAQGVSMAVVLPTGIFGTFAHLRRGNVASPLAFWLGLGSAVAAVLGAQVAAGLQAAVLGQLFGLLVAAIGARMLWSTRG